MPKKTMLDDIRRLGKAVDDRKMSLKDAATELALAWEGTITFEGAKIAVSHWRNSGSPSWDPREPW